MVLKSGLRACGIGHHPGTTDSLFPYRPTESDSRGWMLSFVQLRRTPGAGAGEWASTAAFHTLFLHSVNNFTSWENSNPIELCLFGHAPLILAKGQWLVQSTYPTQLYLMHLGKLSCTWLIQAQLDCAFKSPHSIRLCSGFVAWHLVTCKLRDKPKGNVLETVGFLASVCSTESPRFHAVPLFPPLGAAE